jgi:hypothetical protein
MSFLDKFHCESCGMMFHAINHSGPCPYCAGTMVRWVTERYIPTDPPAALHPDAQDGAESAIIREVQLGIPQIEQFLQERADGSG